MSKATFTPAVTETKTVELEPAKVTLELTISEVQMLRALIGRCSYGVLGGVYEALESLEVKHDISRIKLANTVPSIQASDFIPV